MTRHIKIYYYLTIFLLILSIVIINVGIFLYNAWVIILGVVSFLTAVVRLVLISNIEEGERELLIVNV